MSESVIWSRGNGAKQPRTVVLVGHLGESVVCVYFLRAGKFGYIPRMIFNRRYRVGRS